MINTTTTTDDDDGTLLTRLCLHIHKSPSELAVSPDGAAFEFLCREIDSVWGVVDSMAKRISELETAKETP